MRVWAGRLAMVLLVYAVYLGLLWTQQRGMMFPGAGLAPPPGVALSGRSGAVELDTAFGSVGAVFIEGPPSAPALATLIYFHGNAETVAHNVRAFEALSEVGFNVLLVGYPGYAGSDGSPSRDTLMDAARAGHDWLQQRPGVDARRIIAVGRSIGSGPAAELAAERALPALVLMSPFTSVAAFARRFGAPGILVRDRFDNVARVEAFGGPLLVFHGRHDTIIPYAHGRRVAEASPSARLVTLDCGHNDCPYFDADFGRELEAFARSVFGPLSPEGSSGP